MEMPIRLSSIRIATWNSEYGIPFRIRLLKRMKLHVLASYDSREITNTPRLYINGEEQTVRVQRLPVGTQTLGGGEGFLGDRGAGDRAWDGQMDEVRVYDRILDSTEVSSLSARYAAAYWSQFSITERVETGSVDRVTLELRSDTGEFPNGEFDWSLTEELDGLELRITDPMCEITTSEKVNTVIRLQVNGVMGTRYFSYDLLLDPPEVNSGVYTGTTDSGERCGLKLEKMSDPATLPFWIRIADSPDRGNRLP